MAVVEREIRTSGDVWAAVSRTEAEVETLGAIQPVVAVLTVSDFQVTRTKNSLTFSFKTDAEGNTILYYGLNADTLDSRKIDPRMVTEHEITIDELLPGTLYFYWIITVSSAGIPTERDIESVTTRLSDPPVASNVRIVPAEPEPGDMLEVLYDYWDPEGDPEGDTRIRWYKRVGVGSWHLKEDYNDQIFVPGEVVGWEQSWKVSVQPHDGMEYGDVVFSDPVSTPSPVAKLTGNYSRWMFDELKRYVIAVVQGSTDGKQFPWVDADDNDHRMAQLTLLRRMIQAGIGDKAVGDAFKIVGAGANNDFTISGGGGTPEGALYLFVGGYMALLDADRNYKTDNIIEPNLNSRSTGLVETVLTDKSANFTFGGADNNLVGRKLIPNVADGTAFDIVANTKTTITVTGDMAAVASSGDRYRVEMSTPSGSNRDDLVYFDVFLHEVTLAEDPSLLHDISGISVEGQLRMQVRQTILVRQDSAILPDNYVDMDGLRHWHFKLATIARVDGQDEINPGDVTDQRTVL